MIPKTIHYCWFGGKEKPKSVMKCIASWRKYCPDYVIKEWNEQKFRISERIHQEILSLPISPVMTDDQVKRVIEAVNAFTADV